MKDLAIKKLNEELKALKKTDRHIAVMKGPVHDALVDFCLPGWQRWRGKR